MFKKADIIKTIEILSGIVDKIKMLDKIATATIIVLVIILLLFGNKDKKGLITNIKNLIKSVLVAFFSLFLSDPLWAILYFLVLSINTFFLIVTFQSVKDIILFPLVNIWFIAKYFYESTTGKKKDRKPNEVFKELFKHNLRVIIMYILVINKLPFIITELLKHSFKELSKRLVTIQDLKLLAVLFGLNFVISYFLKKLVLKKIAFVQSEANYVRIGVRLETKYGIKCDKKLYRKLHQINVRNKINGLTIPDRSNIMANLVQFTEVALNEIPDYLKLYSKLHQKLIAYSAKEEIMDFFKHISMLSEDKQTLKEIIEIMLVSNFNIISEYEKGKRLIVDMLLWQENRKDTVLALFKQLSEKENMEDALIILGFLERHSITEKREHLIKVFQLVEDYCETIYAGLIDNKKGNIHRKIHDFCEHFDEISKEKIIEFLYLEDCISDFISESETIEFLKQRGTFKNVKDSIEPSYTNMLKNIKTELLRLCNECKQAAGWCNFG